MIKNLHRLLLLIAVLIVTCTSLQAKVYRTIIDGHSFTVDTLQHTQVGPGTVYTSIKFTGEENSLVFRTFFLIVDTKNNPYLNITCELGNDSIIGVETIRDHAVKRTKPGKYYIAGTNGDFYTTQTPVGIPIYGCVQNGEMATPPNNPWDPQFVITDKLTPWCTTLTQTTSMKINGGESIKINRVNRDRFTNELVLFTPVNGKYTHTAKGGKEVAIQMLEGEKWKINSPVKVKVVGAISESGNMAIAPQQGVLSADGTATSIIAGLKEGDIIEFDLRQPMGIHGGITPNITQAVGSNVFLVRDGKKVPQGDQARHPRTMFGHTKDQGKAIFCILDGRSSISSGGTYAEMSDIMIYAGADYATNGDGGGSSTLYVQNLGVLNRVSDGKERADANGMYLVLDTPEDNVIASISFMDFAMEFPKHGVYRPVFYGYNKYGMLIDNDVKGVKLSCPTQLGFIENEDTFIGSGEGLYALTGTYKGLKTSIAVTVAESDKLAMRLPAVINDTYKEYPVEVQALMNETMMPISPAALKWSIDDNSIATIDPDNGVVKGIVTGETTVHGTVGTFNGSMKLIVEKPTAHAMAIDPNLDPATWKITQSGGKHMVATAMENGMKLVYTGASGRGPNIKLTKELKLWSLPDAIRLRINPGDAPIKKITFTTNANSTGVVTIPITTPLVANEINIIDVKTADWCDAKDMKNYPIILNSLHFDMGTSATGKEYTILMPGIET
ncbi:MAG: phosphodiester glycosidase family protein, partial [Muribaculaceae bacterium]